MTNLNNETIPSANNSVVATALLNAVNSKAKAAKAATVMEMVETAPVLTSTTRDYASMRRFIKKYGRTQVQTALQSAAKEVGGARRAPYPLDAKIVVLTANPHRPDTKDFARFAAYGKGRTVGKAMERGARRVDINYHADRGNIQVVTA